VGRIQKFQFSIFDFQLKTTEARLSNIVQKGQQDRDKKAARMGQKWGKCDGVNEGHNALLTFVSSLFSIGYKRFSMRKILGLYLSSLLANGYDDFIARLCQAVTYLISSDRHLVFGTISDDHALHCGMI
jgi:hypothetical protein